MSILSKFWDYYGRYVLKAAALEQLDELSHRYQQGTLTEIKDAKVWLCAEIQSKRKVPGELRRWACAVVNDTDARDLLAWMSRLRACIKQW